MEDRETQCPLPMQPEEIGKFWDTHSLVDYWAKTNEVDFQVNFRIANRVLVERGLISAHATKLGVSTSKKDLIMSDETKPNQLTPTEDGAVTPLKLPPISC